MDFRFTSIQGNNHIRIGFEGDLIEKSQVDSLMDFINASILEENTKFIIDLEKLDYMNSTGLNLLVTILTKARNNGGEAIVSNVKDRIKRLLVISKLNTIFTVAESNERAEKLIN